MPFIDALAATHRLDLMGLKSLFAAADAAMRKELGLQWVEEQGVVIGMAPGLPESAITMNRGFVAADADSLGRAVELYRDAGVQRFFLHLAGAPDAGVAQRFGLEPARGWQGFARSTADPVAHRSHPFHIRRLHSGEADDFARIACAAFDLGEAAEPWLRRLPDAPGWRVFLTELDGAPAGTGAVFLHGGGAWTDFGATDPSFRGQGAQAAILAHRIGVAREAGCREVFTCTGEAVPGDPQHSYSNILRAGFSETSIRRNLKPVIAGR